MVSGGSFLRANPTNPPASGSSSLRVYPRVSDGAVLHSGSDLGCDGRGFVFL